MSPEISINGETQLYGILGHPIGSTLSPGMHNAAFRALGLNAVYLPFPVEPEQLVQAVEGLRAIRVGGFNLTVPHKLAILPLLQDITPQARAIGAVNTVRGDAGNLAGTNTDGEGFLRALAQDLGWRPQGKRVLLLGAGGAARGIALALLGQGIQSLLITNRTTARAEALANDCRAAFPGADVQTPMWEALAGQAPDLLVNATTVGMGDGNTPVKLDTLEIREGVVDIVYSPLRTPLLLEAEARGLGTANGLGMLLHQGALAFTFWTGREPPLEVMRDALESGLAARKGH